MKSKFLKENKINDAFLKEIQGKKVVFTNGCFDILHIGHVNYLKKCKEYGDVLIVGLNTDGSVKRFKGEKRPIIGQEDRANMLLAINCVDYVVLFDGDTPINLIKEIKPYMYIKGGDYTLDNMLGNNMGFKDIKEYVKTANIINFENDISTSKIIKNILENYSK